MSALDGQMIPFALINRVLSPGGSRGRLTTMIFHRVLEAADPLLPSEPDAALFERRMRRLREWFNILPLEEAVRRLQDGSLPPRAMAITFDDGYANNRRVALPILLELGVPATFFVATGFLDGGCMWNDRIIECVRGHSDDVLDLSECGVGSFATASIDERRATIDAIVGKLKYRPAHERDEAVDRIVAATRTDVRADLMMTSGEVRELADAGMGVGAHTESHPILTTSPPSEALREITASKAFLERLLDRRVSLFAYPNGKPGKDYSAVHVEQVRALGFLAGFSTAPGSASARSDLLQLPRFTPWAAQAWKFGAQLSNNLRDAPVMVA